jgi:acyl-[acyl-carrier-protein]-phospholipid O-acyltransferase/long-chain-fatty-acid--[acyl-carrier-protein] ligase
MNILRSRKFFPLFWTQFLGAFNDNMFKNAAAIFILYLAKGPWSGQEKILLSVATGVYILPYFLFSATAGEVADKFDRAKIARVVKLAEILIVIVATFCLFTGQVYLLLLILFLLGTHATFFGPVKYAILPQHLHAKDLLRGNGYIEASTFLAILIGTIAGGLFIIMPHGPVIVSVALVVIACAGFYYSCLIPKASAPRPRLEISYDIVQKTVNIINHTYKDRRIFLCILAISWSWLLGATYLTQGPAFVKDYLGYQDTVVTLLLIVFSVGIGLGSLMCNRVLKGQVALTYVPLAALGMGVFGIDLYIACLGVQTPSALLSLKEFLVTPRNWRIAVDMFIIAIFAGLYTVPLYAYVQKHAEHAYLARTIAAMNILNALFIVLASVFAIVMFKFSLKIPQLFLITSVITLFVALYIARFFKTPPFS